MTGRCCELAAHGYSRDGKKGCEQIEYGVLTDPAGRPVGVRVFPGDTADPDAFSEILPVIRDMLGIQRLVLVGDLGQVLGVEQAHLQRPVITGEFGDRWCPQCGVPGR